VRRTFLALLPLGLWAGAVLVVGGLEVEPPVAVPRHTDKLAHVLMYGVGGALAAWAGRMRGGWTGMACLVFVVLVGAMDELRQTQLATRHGDVWDWVADALGAILFYLIGARLLRRK
jgi:VanZ family protein